eukprot:COSAG02_NODE_412_length_22836_cov_41.209966_13_plen_63_part_00
MAVGLLVVVVGPIKPCAMRTLPPCPRVVGLLLLLLVVGLLAVVRLLVVVVGGVGEACVQCVA